MNKEILLTNGHFNIINKYDEGVKDELCVERIYENVVVLPYTLTENQYIDKIGVLNEFNLLRFKNYSTTAVTGSFKDKETSLECAKRELNEETGLNIEDSYQWIFLGYLNCSKFDSTDYPCYAVDATNVKIQKKKTDGSVSEKRSTFEFIELNDAIKVNDAFILSLLLKLFSYKNYLSF